MTKAVFHQKLFLDELWVSSLANILAPLCESKCTFSQLSPRINTGLNIQEILRDQFSCIYIYTQHTLIVLAVWCFVFFSFLFRTAKTWKRHWGPIASVGNFCWLQHELDWAQRNQIHTSNNELAIQARKITDNRCTQISNVPFRSSSTAPWHREIVSYGIFSVVLCA